MAIDNRLVRVSITVNNLLKTYDGLAIIAEGSKYASATQNTATIKIANLNKDDREFLATEGSPFSRSENRPRNSVILEAGRESLGLSTVFEGDIDMATISQPPDIWTTIKATTENYQKGNLISTSESALSNLSSIARKAADAMGIGLNFLATDRQIANYGFTGAAAKQIDKIAQLANVDAFIDDALLIIKNRNKPIRGGARVISKETGMVGIPEPTEFGYNVRFLFNPDVKVGDLIEVVSENYPTANGQYVVYKLNFNITNRDTAFYYIAEARRPGEE